MEDRKVLVLVGQLSESQVRDELAHENQTMSDLDEVLRLIERRFDADKNARIAGICVYALVVREVDCGAVPARNV